MTRCPQKVRVPSSLQVLFLNTRSYYFYGFFLLLRLVGYLSFFSIEILQRKDVWSKAQVVSYLDISAKTFDRWKASGEIKVKTIGGKDYCLLTDLKDRLKN